MSISIDGNTLTIRLNHLTPSLNNLLGQNHWILTKEKARAKLALSSAISACEPAFLTTIIMLVARNTSRTQCELSELFRGTTRAQLRLSGTSRRFHTKTRKRQW